MEPAELDDRELGCIDFFLFCFLLSSGLVWAPSWAILAPSWATLASSWAILAPSWLHLGPSGLHLGSPKPPEACPDLTRLSPEAPRGSQSPNHTNRQKGHRIQIEILVRFAFSFWRPYPIRVKCRFKNVFDENTTFAQKNMKT